MIIGINATAAIKKERTGVEEYVFRLLKHLVKLEKAKNYRFIFYTPINLKWPCLPTGKFLPMWTHLRLGWEMIVRRPDVLFIPVHILPLIHPRKSVVAIMGLEYEYYPQYYSFFRRFYLRWSAKYALRRAAKIIAISENTKKDLIKFYGGDANKIKVVHLGVERPMGSQGDELSTEIKNLKPYLLYVGRIETKKNIQGLIAAFKILKNKYKISHKLVLAGSRGYGYEEIKNQISTFWLADKNCDDIVELGYIDEKLKWELLENADVFVFPSFYEGFGIPVLEAQLAGAPVAASGNSSLPEVAGEGAVFFNASNSNDMADKIFSLLNDKELREEKIKRGLENAKQFSWEKCAQETLDILIN